MTHLRIDIVSESKIVNWLLESLLASFEGQIGVEFNYQSVEGIGINEKVLPGVYHQNEMKITNRLGRVQKLF